MTGTADDFDIHTLRADVTTGKRPLRITTHAQVEAFRDGLLLADLLVHIVVEDTPDEGVIVTAYIPDKSQWIADKKRRKSRKKNK